MVTVVLSIHILITISMIGLILLQKTEGNAAGAGFSGSASVESLMRPRARPNPLGRATTILGISFFVTSIALALLARPHAGVPTSIMAQPPSAASVPKIDETPAPADPAVPTAPAAPAAPTVPNN
jgi:preprotein translocase subunit SecG